MRGLIFVAVVERMMRGTVSLDIGLNISDTSFMYIIACLCMLKIYQSRHPDINAKAHVAFLVMAIIIFMTVVGVVSIVYCIHDMIQSMMIESGYILESED